MKSLSYITCNGLDSIIGFDIRCSFKITELACYSENNPVKLSESVADFLTHLVAAGRAPATIEAYGRDLGRLESRLPSTDIRAITDTLLEEAVIQLCDSAASGLALSVPTVNRIKSTWRSFFGWCQATGRVTRNPSWTLKLARRDAKRTLALGISESQAFLAKIRASSDRLARRDEALFAIYAYTGMRRTEALALQLGDYDQGGKSLQVRDSKGGRSRSCVVPSRLADALDRYLSSLTLCRNRSGDDALFPGGSFDRALSPRGAQTRFQHWRRLSGIRDGITIRSFRAGFATMLHNAKVDSLLIARALGHADCRTTERYIEMDQSEVRDAIEEATSDLH